ncbi:hypothetical protein EMGBS8_05840 [Verrucomicrobiota bacterium]|nr:hypothetical protein EMGBS8_05840 [Verrucomicrobiota bacterium]
MDAGDLPHGAGERGSNVQLVRKNGLTQTLEQRGTVPYVMIAPQCPANSGWNVGTLDKLLDQVLADYRVDKKRVVLTGLSLGGFGTWSWSTEHPERFAGPRPHLRRRQDRPGHGAQGHAHLGVSR